MPYGFPLTGGGRLEKVPTVGRPKRDRKKIAASRKARRRG